MSYELYREDGADFRSVKVRLEGDKLTVDTHDMGEATERFLDSDEYEFWTAVNREHWGSLLVALIREFLGGNPRATDQLREICKKHGVPHDWQSWV